MVKLKATQKVPEEKAFWLNDGKILMSLNEFKKELKSMDDETFYHHVNDERHDFANWIYDVIQDKTLAKKIRIAKTKDEMLVALGIKKAPVKKKVVKKKVTKKKVVKKKTTKKKTKKK